MKNKRIIVILIAAALLIAALAPAVFAIDLSTCADLEMQVCKSVNGGVPVPFGGETISRSEDCALYFTYEITSDTPPVVGEKYAFKIVGPFALPNTRTVDILYNGKKVAEVVVLADGSATLEFNATAAAERLLDKGTRGNFYFSASFDADEIPNAGAQDINVGIDGKPLTPLHLNFTITPVEATATPVKSGVATGNVITWTVAVTPTITNATADLAYPLDDTKDDRFFKSWTLTDVVGATNGYWYVGNSAELTKTVSGVTTPVTATISFDSYTDTLTCVFPSDTPVDGATTFTLTYQMQYSDAEIGLRLQDGAAEFLNKAESSFEFPKYISSTDPATPGEAELDYQTDTADSDEAKVEINGGAFDKTGVVLDDDEQGWTLTVSNTWGLAGALLEDDLPDYLDIVEVNNKPAIYDGGSASGAPLPEYTSGASATYPSYSFDAAANKLTIHLDDSDKSAQSFYYETKVNSKYNGESIENHAEFSWQGAGTPPSRQVIYSKDAIVAPASHYMSKISAYDKSRHSLTWTVSVTNSSAALTKIKFVDTIPAGQSLDENSYKIQNASGALVPVLATNQYTTVTLNPDGTTTLEVDFEKAGQSSLTTGDAFSYVTVLDDTQKALWAANTDPNNVPKAKNKVVMHATGFPTQGYALTAECPVQSEVLSKAAQGYDHVTKIVTWRAVVNDNEMLMTDIELTDVMPAGWRYIAASVTVTQNNLPVTPIRLAFTNNNTRMRLVLPAAAVGDKPYIVEYQTELIDPSALLDVDEWSVLNNATLTAVQTPQGGVSVSDTQIINAPMLTKTAQNLHTGAGGSYITDPFVEWKIIINQGLTTITAPRGHSSLTLHDTLHQNLTLVNSTVKLWHVSVDAAGNLTRGSELSRPTEYDFTYDSRTRQFRLDFKKRTITEAYELYFETDIIDTTLNPSPSYDNTVGFDGLSAAQMNAVSTQFSTDFGGGTTVRPRQVYRTVHVDTVDEAGNPIPGAVFTLTNNVDGSVVTGVSDANGVVEFIVREGDYTLVQTHAPGRYALPAVNGWNITVNNATPTTTVVDGLRPLRAPAANRSNPYTGRGGR